MPGVAWAPDARSPFQLRSRSRDPAAPGPGTGAAGPRVAPRRGPPPVRGQASQPLVRLRDRGDQLEPPRPARGPGWIPRGVLPGRSIAAVLDGRDEPAAGDRGDRGVRDHGVLGLEGDRGGPEGGAPPDGRDGGGGGGRPHPSMRSARVPPSPPPRSPSTPTTPTAEAHN